MAVVTTKAKGVTNRDASPKVLSDSAYVKASLKGSIGQVTAVSGDSIASKYILCTIPSNAIVHAALLSCSAITTCAADIGLYKKTADDGTAGAVVSVAFFKAAQSLASALAATDITNGNVITLALSEKKVWELLGLASDPNLVYDVAATLTAAAGSGGNVQMKIQYGE